VQACLALASWPLADCRTCCMAHKHLVWPVLLITCSSRSQQKCTCVKCYECLVSSVSQTLLCAGQQSQSSHLHAGVYFAASAFVCAVCFLLYACILPKLPFVQYHRKRSRATLQPYSMEPVPPRPAVELNGSRSSSQSKEESAADTQLGDQEVTHRVLYGTSTTPLCKNLLQHAHP